MDFIINEIDDYHKVIQHIQSDFPTVSVITLEGDLGAGKTTFVKEFCKYFQVDDNVSSPTFSIINEYASANGKVIYHMDLYRLDAMDELMEIGFEEYLYSGNLCFIEWPGIANPLLPKEYLNIRLEIIDETTRKIVVLDPTSN